MNADHDGASQRRAAGPGENLHLAGVMQSMVYDIVGESDGPWVQRRAGITTLEELRADVEMFAWANPAVTWHVIARTTTTTEAVADHLLEQPATGNVEITDLRGPARS